MTFTLPKDRVSEEAAFKGGLVFQPSSRITALISGSSKSIGASCNVYLLEDELSDIAYSRMWSMMVQGYQGAPSIDFSKLRPKGSKLGTGGQASGAVSFMLGYDTDLSQMKREEKKNSAGIAYLDWNHPELDTFLRLGSSTMYKAVYIPHHDSPEAIEFLSNTKILKKLAAAYDSYQAFLVKRPLPLADGTELGVNLCTEVTIPKKGYCILGVVNLAALSKYALHILPSYMKLAAKRMHEYMLLSRDAAQKTVLACDSPANRQFGLGMMGLASLLGNLGIKYSELADYGDKLRAYGVDDIDSIVQLAEKHFESDNLVTEFVYYLAKGYQEATQTIVNQDPDIRAMWCIQPTVSTAQRCYDTEGYHVSPEIQPVVGLRHKDAVSTRIKSAIKGDRDIDYAPNTETIDYVPYEVYARVSSFFQWLMNATGKAHRHSHCFYGKRFTVENLKGLYQGDNKLIESMYYRLTPMVNTESLDKSQLWQDVTEGELFEDETLLDDIMDAFESFEEDPDNASCTFPIGNQTLGSSDCGCTM